MSNKSKLIGISISLILILYSCILGGKSSFNFMSMFIIALGIKAFITTLVAEIKDKKQRK